MACVLIVGACDSSDPAVDEANESLAVRGALNVAFERGPAELLSQARFVSIDASQKWLDISLQGRVQDGERSERLALIVRVPLDGDRALIAPGNYRYGENGMPGLDAEVDYERREGERAFSRYQFEGLSLSLRIEQADEGHLVGRFSLDARQREGLRGLDGAVEEVQLANDGEVNVQAIFDITNVDVITP